MISTRQVVLRTAGPKSLCSVRPFFGLRHGFADPQCDQCRQDAHKEDDAMAGGLLHPTLIHDPGKQTTCSTGQQHAHIHCRLQCGCNPWSPLLRPSLGKQRGTYRPLAADAQRRKEAADQQVRPVRAKRRETGEPRIEQNGEHKRATTTQHIAKSAEKASTQRPPDEESRLDDRGLCIDILRRGSNTIVHQQSGDEGRGHKCVDVHVEAVEEPAKPRGDAGAFLMRREIAEACDFGVGRLGHEGASLSQ
jgi:hypothetical protein